MKKWIFLPLILTGCVHWPGIDTKPFRETAPVPTAENQAAIQVQPMAVAGQAGTTYTILGAVTPPPNWTACSVYVGTSSGSYSEKYILTPPVRTFSIPNRQLKTAYFLTATASAGPLESQYGNEVRYLLNTLPKRAPLPALPAANNSE